MKGCGKKYATGGSTNKPTTIQQKVADRNRRMAEAMGDAPPTPKPPPRPTKPKPFANGGPIAPAVMPTPQPRPSNFTVGPLQFGGPNGMGGAGTPTRTPGAPSTNPNYASDRNRPMRDQRDMDNMKQKIKERLGDRMGGLRDRLAGIGQRVRPNAPRPVAAGGGYKKGGAVDGCAIRGKTNCKTKSYK